jgi:hypothetical protein
MRRSPHKGRRSYRVAPRWPGPHGKVRDLNGGMAYARCAWWFPNVKRFVNRKHKVARGVEDSDVCSVPHSRLSRVGEDELVVAPENADEMGDPR